MKKLKGILDIVAYQLDKQGEYTLVVRQANGYYNTLEGMHSFGLKNLLENSGVLKLESWVDIRTWMRMMDNLHEEQYVPNTDIEKGSPEAMELEYEDEMSQEQYEHEMRMDAHFSEQELQDAAEDKAILGDLSALDALKKRYTQDTLPDVCPDCGNSLRHKMSGRICDNYPCNYSVSL